MSGNHRMAALGMMKHFVTIKPGTDRRETREERNLPGTGGVQAELWVGTGDAGIAQPLRSMVIPHMVPKLGEHSSFVFQEHNVLWHFHNRISGLQR